MSKHITLLQHVSFEGPGAIADWAEANGNALDVIRLDEGQALPNVEGVEGLIVMGGPMGVGDADRISFLGPERRFIAAVIDKGLPVLGVCLGAQIIASVRGADVYPNHLKEVGWFPIEWRNDARRLIDSELAGDAMVFHWHGDTFELPRGATALAASEACENQGFFLPPRCIGLQFHLDATHESVAGMIANCPEDLDPGPLVQTPADMLADPARFESLHVQLASVLRFLFG